MGQNVFTTKSTCLKLNQENGSVLSYQINGREFCAKGGEARPLFTMKLLDEKGSPTYVNALEARKISVESAENKYTITYDGLAGKDLGAVVTVCMQEDEQCHWHISADNHTDQVLEWIEFPQISVPDALKGEGGDAELFWPTVEGVVIDNKKIRENSWLAYKEIGGQSGGYCGMYPGSCPMQFMSYYNQDGGFYIGAHDKAAHPKTVEFRGEQDGIALEFRLFCGGARGHVEPGYDMVTAPFAGDWQDGAEIYRSWAEKNMRDFAKLRDREDLPGWLEKSPVVMLYPIRGTIDHGDMTPNLYYPYRNVLPIAEEFAEKMQSTIMALPMHWEGTAPWATPYVWPPYGGEEEFTDFVQKLHEQGNLAGVYCSGIGWTTKSFLDPQLDISDKYDENLMCRTPQGTIEQSKVIGEPIRLGYDMCPESAKVGDIVLQEVLSIAGSGCDYAQYFDQNLGGMSSLCYGRDHGHGPGPGIWQNQAMKRIFDKVNGALKEQNSHMVIGCEGAAGEAFIADLPFNDLRFNVGLFLGKPVPAYSYIFHEYINNFMGNQNTIHNALSLEDNPYCVLFRIAYSFAAGDMLTVALGDQGKIHWGWDVPWDVAVPEQEPIFTLIKNLNHWRLDKKEFLRYGKMIKAKVLEGTEVFTVAQKCGETLSYPSLLTTRWCSGEGKEAQVIVNYLPYEQTCSVAGETLTVPGLSAVWID